MNRNVTATILLVLGVGIYFTVTKAVIADGRAVKAVNNEYTSAIASAEELIKVRDKVLKDYNALSAEDRSNLDKMIPSTVDNIRLIIDLNGVALRHGFSLRNIKAVAGSSGSRAATPSMSPTATPVSASPMAIPSMTGAASQIATPTLDTVTVSFSVTAPYLQFIGFLQDLEANLRIMDVTHLTVTANDSGTYDFGVDLKTYWIRQ